MNATVYTVRRFPSATGHVWFQVMSPLGGRVYESTEKERALARAAALNEQLAPDPYDVEADWEERA